MAFQTGARTGSGPRPKGMRSRKRTVSGKKRRERSTSRRFFRKKVCKFCVDKTESIDFRDSLKLQKFVTEKGKIVPRRISGNCAWHQRLLARAIKRGRQVALMPFTGE